MDTLFLSILNMSLTGAFIIAAICLARQLLKKAPKAISYALWAVVGFRLVIPFTIESFFSLIRFNPAPIPLDIATQVTPRIDSGVPIFNNAINNAVSNVLPAAEPYYSANPLQIWVFIGAWIWFVAAVFLMVYGIASFFILKRKMQNAAWVEANVYEADNIKSPFVLGIFLPKIYLPVGLFGQEREYIVLHEQTHIRRRDHIVKFAAYFILCLHWFNPLAWVAFWLMGADMEMSCDERVMKELGDGISEDYSMSLVRIATNRRIIAGSPLAFGEGGMKERVKRILNFKNPSRKVVVLAVIFVAVMSIGFAFNRITPNARAFPMQSVNIADLQSNEIVQQVASITNASSDRIIVPESNFAIQLNENFEWDNSGTIAMYIPRQSFGRESRYYAQLRIFTQITPPEFYVTALRHHETLSRTQRPVLLRSHLLVDFLDALKYLPQEHILDLTRDNPAAFNIIFVGYGNFVPLNDDVPRLFYDRNGLTEEGEFSVWFNIQPLFTIEGSTQLHGTGADVINVFFTGGENVFFVNSDVAGSFNSAIEPIPHVGAAHETHRVVNAMPLPRSDMTLHSIQIGADHGGFGYGAYTLTIHYNLHAEALYYIPGAEFESIAAELFGLIGNLQAVTFSVVINGETDTNNYIHRWSISRTSSDVGGGAITSFRGIQESAGQASVEQALPETNVGAFWWGRAFTIASPLRTQSSLENTVSMSVTELDTVNNRMFCTISNDSDYELLTGLHFMVEYFDGTDWRIVPWYGDFTGVFHDIGFNIEPHDSLDLTLDLGFVEPLHPGLPRIRALVFRYLDSPIRGDIDLHDVITEFYWE